MLRTTLKKWAEGAQPWSQEEAQHLSNTARQCLTRHECQGKRDPDMRDNCGACVLSGYERREERGTAKREGPNYAGWVRIYVELGIVPVKFKKAALAELERMDNVLYLNALKRDIVTFL